MAWSSSALHGPPDPADPGTDVPSHRPTRPRRRLMIVASALVLLTSVPTLVVVLAGSATLESGRAPRPPVIALPPDVPVVVDPAPSAALGDRGGAAGESMRSAPSRDDDSVRGSASATADSSGTGGGGPAPRRVAPGRPIPLGGIPQAVPGPASGGVGTSGPGSGSGGVWSGGIWAGGTWPGGAGTGGGTGSGSDPIGGGSGGTGSGGVSPSVECPEAEPPAPPPAPAGIDDLAGIDDPTRIDDPAGVDDPARIDDNAWPGWDRDLMVRPEATHSPGRGRRNGRTRGPSAPPTLSGRARRSTHGDARVGHSANRKSLTGESALGGSGLGGSGLGDPASVNPGSVNPMTER